MQASDVVSRDLHFCDGGLSMIEDGSVLIALGIIDHIYMQMLCTLFLAVWVIHGGLQTSKSVSYCCISCMCMHKQGQ